MSDGKKFKAHTSSLTRMSVTAKVEFSWGAFQQVFLSASDLSFHHLPALLYILHSVADRARSLKVVNITTAAQAFVRDAAQQPADGNILVLLTTFKSKAPWVTKYLNKAMEVTGDNRPDTMVDLKEAMGWWI